ncbi:MAG: heme exporter protein, partial [Pseudomonadota bacterium]|nr:heme exporter protein [Pseudomonadota bacterium]
MNAFIAAVRAIVWKDLASEWRSREQMASMFFFALLTLFIFNFSLNLDPAQVRELMPGLIWISFSFTGVIGLGRSFIAERENDCLDALLMSPAPKGALYL